MGLYDTVRVRYSMPEPGFQDRDFQTKDLGCWLDAYEITVAGELIRTDNAGGEAVYAIDTSDTDAPFDLTFDTKEGVMEMVGFEVRNDPNSGLAIFQARFKDGKCVGIQRRRDERNQR